MEPQWARSLDYNYPSFHRDYTNPSGPKHQGPAVDCVRCWTARLADYTRKPVLAGSSQQTGRGPLLRRPALPGPEECCTKEAELLH
jgi:hypothetical protein